MKKIRKAKKIHGRHHLNLIPLLISLLFIFLFLFSVFRFPIKLVAQSCSDVKTITVKPCAQDSSSAQVTWSNGTCGGQTYYAIAWCPSWVPTYNWCYHINHKEGLLTRSYNLDGLEKNSQYKVYIWTYHGVNGSPNKPFTTFTQSCPIPTNTPVATKSISCVAPNKPEKTSPQTGQIFRLTNGALTLNLSFHDGGDTGCYPHQTYFGLAKGSTLLDSGWLSEDKYLIKSPNQKVSFSKTIYEDGVYTYRARSRNNLSVMGPYDTDPFEICVDSVAPNLPQEDKLSCAYNSSTKKFNLTYSWKRSYDNGCANFHEYPDWAQISFDSNFSRAENYNNWNNKTSVSLSNLSEGTTVYAHVRSRDKVDNQTNWTAKKSLIINCQNCTGCISPSTTSTPSATKTPTPTLTNTPIPTLTPTPSLIAPVCDNIVSTYNSADNTIRTSFYFEGKNSSNVLVNPYCFYSENVSSGNPIWISMKVISAKVNPPKIGRPYPGQTTGSFTCQSSPVIAGLSYTTAAQTSVFYDLNGNLRRDANEPAKTTVCTPKPTINIPINTVTPVATLIPTITVTPTPTLTNTPISTLTPTPSLIAPVCDNIVSTYNSADNTIRTSFYFEGKNSSNVLVNPYCFYSENVSSGNPIWISMKVISAKVNPPKIGRPYPGQTTGSFTCQSSPVIAGLSYTTAAQTSVFYDLNGNLRRDANEPAKTTVCTPKPTINIPINTVTPVATLIPTITVTPTPTPAVDCVPNSPTCPKKKMGDVNCDCNINEDDRTKWIGEYRDKTLKGRANDLLYDFNDDERVDLLDYGILRRNYGN